MHAYMHACIHTDLHKNNFAVHFVQIAADGVKARKMDVELPRIFRHTHAKDPPTPEILTPARHPWNLRIVVVVVVVVGRCSNLRFCFSGICL